jgi:hypothetical protein
MLTRVGNEEECSAAKSEEPPLVAGFHKRSHKTGHDHHLIHEDHIKDGGGGHPTSQEQIQKQEGCRQKPIDVSDIEDLTHIASHLRVAALELNLDGGPTQIAAHAKVRDRSDQRDTGGDVVEDALIAGLSERQAHERKGGSSHNSCDGEVLTDR